MAFRLQESNAGLADGHLFAGTAFDFNALCIPLLVHFGLASTSLFRALLFRRVSRDPRLAMVSGYRNH